MIVQQWDMRVSFSGTREQAQKLKETLETAAAVFFEPTEANTSALFTLGFEAIAGVAATERERA